MRKLFLFLALPVLVSGCFMMADSGGMSKDVALALVKKLVVDTGVVYLDVSMGSYEIFSKPGVEGLLRGLFLKRAPEHKLVGSIKSYVFLTERGKQFELKHVSDDSTEHRLRIANRVVSIRDVSPVVVDQQDVVLVAYQIDYTNITPFVVLQSEDLLSPTYGTARFVRQNGKWVRVHRQ